MTNPKLWKDAASNTEPGQDSPLTIIISVAAGKSTQSKCSEYTILKFVSLLRFLWNLIEVQKPKQYFKTNHFPSSDVHFVHSIGSVLDCFLSNFSKVGIA